VKHHIFKYNQPFQLESGEILPELVIQYSTSGDYEANKENVLWVCHALTANSDVESWWPGVVGESCFFDPKDYFIICANIISSCYGSSGPTEVNPLTNQPYYLSFPEVTIRDMVRAHELLREYLKIQQIKILIGGSLGGQQAMEWAIIQPTIFEKLVLLSTNAYHSAWGIAFNETQRMTIALDATWKNNSLDAGRDGLKAARAIAMLSYRSYETYVETQTEDDFDKIGDYKAVSYQHYQGEKLVKRFNCHSYYYLSKAMDSHHVARNRGSVDKALSLIKAQTLVIGISSDILFPPHEQRFLADSIPGARYEEIESLYGHDGFLVEALKINHVLSTFI
jgi:homoserine O-acetyltransferase